MSTVSGKNLIVSFGSTPELIACSTSCTLSLNQAVTEATCKDTDSWTYQIPAAKSWEITCDALYQDTVTGNSYHDLAQFILAGPNDVAVVFEEINNPNLTVTDNTWSGQAVLTSLVLNGDDNAPATYSATFTGNGPLTFVAGTDA